MLTSLRIMKDIFLGKPSDIDLKHKVTHIPKLIGSIIQVIKKLLGCWVIGAILIPRFSYLQAKPQSCLSS